MTDNDQCRECGLYKTCTHLVDGEGEWDADVLIVGEAPGEQEDKSGRPFVGKSGQLLRRVLREVGLKSVFITNTVRCRPSRNRKPTKKEIKACSSFLDDEIASVNPKLIIPLGEPALSRFVELKKGDSISNWVGGRAYVEIKGKSYPIFPMYHPAYIIRRMELYDVYVRMFEVIRGGGPEVKKQYGVVRTGDDANALFNMLKTVESFSFDLETTGLNFMTDTILCVSFSWKEGVAATLPLLGEDRVKIWTPDEAYWIRDELKEVFGTELPKIAHNCSFDMKFLRKIGIEVNNCAFDTMLAHHLLDPESSHKLEDLAVVETDMGRYDLPLKEYFPTKQKKEDRDYSKLSPEVLYEYANGDADCTYRLAKVYHKLLTEQKFMRIFKYITMPVRHVLTDMEYRGVRIDKIHLNHLKECYHSEMEQLEEKMASHPDVVSVVNERREERAAKRREKWNHSKHLRSKYSEEKYARLDEEKSVFFNFNSSPQLANLFFDRLELPITHRSDKTKEPSVDKDALSGLSGKHVLIDSLVEYRSVANIYNTFLKSVANTIDDNDRIHTSYNVHGTPTGRLSSSGPNIQNIPIRQGPEIRMYFMASHLSGIILESDYKQIEFRCLANYADCDNMIGDIRNGLDIHTVMASIVLGIPPEEVTEEQRSMAKATVFGIMYGRGAKSIAFEHGIPVETAERIIWEFFKRYPRAERCLARFRAEAKRYGDVYNHFGRRRKLPMVDSDVRSLRAEALRQAINTPIQSMAADITSIGTIRVSNRMKEDKIPADLILTNHDALALDIFDSKDLDYIAPIVVEEMEHKLEGIRVPITVDQKIGKNWGSLEKYLVAA